MVGNGRDLKGLSPEDYGKWSRYGMDPYNWVLDGKIIASVYPTDVDYLVYLKKNHGISMAINLTESSWPEGWSTSTGIEQFNFPIVDMSIPSETDVVSILRLIQEADGPIMVHCAAGIGRTGTIIALYLVDNGMDPGEAIEHVRKRRKGSIQTIAQEQLVHHWSRRRK